MCKLKNNQIYLENLLNLSQIIKSLVTFDFVQLTYMISKMTRQGR